MKLFICLLNLCPKAAGLLIQPSAWGPGTYHLQSPTCSCFWGEMPSLNLFFLASWLTTLLYYLSFFSPSFLVLLLNITIFKKSISISCITSLSCIMCLAAVFIAKSEKSIVIRSLLPVFYLTTLLLKKKTGKKRA